MLKAAKYVTELRCRYLEMESWFGFETVFSSNEKVEFVQKADDAGYFIGLFFLATDAPEINVRSASKRVEQGGHDVLKDKNTVLPNSASVAR